jgi:hypothetical protein
MSINQQDLQVILAGGVPNTPPLGGEKVITPGLLSPPIGVGVSIAVITTQYGVTGPSNAAYQSPLGGSGYIQGVTVLLGDENFFLNTQIRDVVDPLIITYY